VIQYTCISQITISPVPLCPKFWTLLGVTVLMNDHYVSNVISAGFSVGMGGTICVGEFVFVLFL